MVAAAVARAIFESSSGGSAFEIFGDDADTEPESDAPTDPELGRADYWKCVKCKNDKNNPMYRYCEKCYQVINTGQPLPSISTFGALRFCQVQSNTIEHAR